MPRRRYLAVAVATVAVVGCEPSVPKRTNPSSVDYAVFDPSTSQIPLPNDLALQPDAIAAQSGAQQEFLQSLASAGGFPNDQEAPITIDLQRWDIAADGKVTKSAPPGIDPATVSPTTLIVLAKDLTTGAVAPVAVDVSFAPDPANASAGQLKLRNKPDATGSRRWKPKTQYIVLLRGGANGVMTSDGREVVAMATMYLITQGKDLSLPENQYLLPGDGRPGRAATGQQLETLRRSYLPVFAIADQSWGAGASKELISVQTFTIAPSAGDLVLVDAGSGQVPLPSDLLLDPKTGKVSEQPGAFCGGVLDATGSCATARAIATLDGFSTTAMYLAPTAAPVLASTVTSGTVLVYQVGAAGLTRVFYVVDQLTSGGANKANYLTQPPPIQVSPGGGTCPGAADCVSQTIGLQPAVPVPLPGGGQLGLPPFKESTRYAVVVTDGVKDAAGKALVRNSFTKLLFFQNPLADLTTGKSTVSALTDAQAVAIETLRTQLMPGLLAKVQADKGITPDHVVMAYTVTTQSITGTAVQLAAAPYSAASAIVPGTPFPLCGGPAPSPACADNHVTGLPAPLPAVQEMVVVPTPTLNPIDPTTGALNPNSSAWTLSTLNAFVFLPQSTDALPPCPGAASALKCAPLVIFKHGLTRTKSDVFAVANTLASFGFVVAAIDAPLHGDRSYCTQDSECICPVWAPGCTPSCQLFPAPQPTDPVRVGLCGGGSVANTDGALSPSAIPGLSGKFILTRNFFRSRDALREDILDTSSLVLALSPPTPAANAFTSELVARGMAIDGTKVSLLAFSMGGVHGVMSLAANPRIGRAVLTDAGATTMDIVTTGTFASEVIPLLGTPGTAQYLQTLQVAKWILDPAEPINFASHILGSTLPSPLSGNQPQPAKNVFGQYAVCDQTVPNQFELLLYGQLGLAPTPTSSQNGFTPYLVTGAGTAGSCNPAVNPHSFLIDPTLDPTATGDAQLDAATYLQTLTLPSASSRP